MISDYGYVRVGLAVPNVRPAAVGENVTSMVALARQSRDAGCDLVLFPELCITGYTCADLFFHEMLLQSAGKGLVQFANDTVDMPQVFVLGLPAAADGQLFDVAAVVCRGDVLGVVPKTYLPGYHEFYEPRWFASERSRIRDRIALPCGNVPFGADLLFREDSGGPLCFGIEVCEDLWATIPPSSYLCMAGANLVLNPSASNDLVGKSDYRRDLLLQQSARCLCAYAYCSAGPKESTTDLVFGGDCMVAENGTLLARSERFLRTPHLTTADVDLGLIHHERLTTTTFAQGIAQQNGKTANVYREIGFPRPNHAAERRLQRTIDPHPFVPDEPKHRHERCQEVLALQSSGLATRLEHIGIENVVIGLSGGLDSTLALLVCIEAFRRLDLERGGIHAITMPGFGTSARTKENAEALCRTLGISLETIDIAAACRLHFGAIGHDGETADVTFENVQARERTQILMDKANMLDALVIGTGDLSELALGWCTYNADHMSMYGVNAGVPKTLVRFLIEYYASDKADAGTADTLRDILDTPISPELLPTDQNGDIAQKTESVIGPYELHDFFLYYLIRHGFRPAKGLMLAEAAFGETYDLSEIRRWLKTFCRRFFSQQFKRSCLPDGPKVGTIALSPRGDWRMPSDASAAEWLAELDALETDAG